MNGDVVLPRPRRDIGTLPAYVPGRAMTGKPAAVLASNELPFGPLPEVVDAISAEVKAANLYPDASGQELERAIGEHLGVAAECIAIGPGSVGLLHQVMRAYTEPGSEVVYAWRSFEAYPGLVSLYHAQGRPVPLNAALEHDLPAMARAVTDRTRVVIVCNPNNPTGTVVTPDALRTLVDAVPPDCLIVLDEAYREFCPTDDFADGIEMFGSRPNVCVLRTFSKAYGLAGLRVGYAIAHPQVIQHLHAVRLHFAVTQIARRAATESIKRHDQAAARLEAVMSERDRMREELTRTGWSVVRSYANFVWLGLGPASAAFAEHCRAAGVVVRPLGDDGVRVTAGPPEWNDRFLAAAAEWAVAHRGLA